MVDYFPNSERDKARINQLGRKVLPRIFLGYALIAVRIWKGDILIADIEELEKVGCIRNISQKTECKRSPDNPKKDWEFIFPVADGSAKLSGREYEFQEPALRREPTVRRENLSGESEGDREEFQPEETKDDLEIHKDFWSIQGDFIYRHHIFREFNYTCREKNHFQFHWSSLMSSGQFILIWTLHKKNELMPIGMSTETEICQIRGRVSQDIHYWTKLLREYICGPGRRLTKIQTTSSPDHMWPDAWIRIGKPRKEERDKNGQSRNQYSNIPDNWEEFILLIQVMKSTKTSIKMQGESWRHQRQLQCHAKERSPKLAFGKPVIQKQERPKHLKQRQDSVVSLKHMNPRDKESNQWGTEFRIALQFSA